MFPMLFVGRDRFCGGCNGFLIGGNRQSGLLVRCWLVVLFFLFSVFCGPVSCDDGLCVEYSLQNECTPILETVSIEQDEQEDFFNENVSLTVSDVRMRSENCRKPFLLYYCQLMFGGFGCQSSSQEEQLCFEQETCRQVSESCGDDFPLDCLPSFPPSPTSPTSPTSRFERSSRIDCRKEVEEQIEEVKEKIIRVESCLDGSKEQINCCNDPFIFDDNDECVIECPQYLFGKSLEESIRLTVFVLNWLSFVVLIVTIPPLYLLANISYPNNVLLFAFGAYIISVIVYLWPIFDGGVSQFICGGEKSYLDGLIRFEHLPRNIVLYSFWISFSGLSYMHWCLFAFNLFCNSVRPFTSYFNKFIDQPVRPLIIYLMEGLCFGISGVLGLTSFIYGFENKSKVFFFPSPSFGFPVTSNSVLSKLVLVLFLMVMGCVASFFMILSSILFLYRGRHILYFQWRSIVVGCLWCCWIAWTLLIFFFGFHGLYPNKTELFEYPNCVASHPRTNSPPCQHQHGHVAFFTFASIFTTFFFLILLFIAYWTNSLVVLWWKELLCSRRILRLRKEESWNLQSTVNQYGTMN